MCKLAQKVEPLPGWPAGSENNFRRSARAISLATALAVAGVAGLSGCKREETAAPAPPVEQPAGYVLSDGTKAVLAKLESPVEVRFYALLDSTYAPAAMRDLAGRAAEMLTAFENVSGGKLTVKRSNVQSQESENAASKDGLKMLELDKADPSFLGFVVAGRDKKEVLPLLPEWEPAMESDLARALARVSAVQVLAKPVVQDPQVAAKISAELKRLIPDPQSTSVEEGTRILRESAMNEFKAAAAEMKQQIEAAQQQLGEAQNKPEAERQAALQRVQAVQLEQGEKLKAISARLQEEIEKFQQLKASQGK